MTPDEKSKMIIELLTVRQRDAERIERVRNFIIEKIIKPNL